MLDRMHTPCHFIVEYLSSKFNRNTFFFCFTWFKKSTEKILPEQQCELSVSTVFVQSSFCLCAIELCVRIHANKNACRFQVTQILINLYPNNVKVKGVWSCSAAFRSRAELQFTLLLQVRKEIAYWSGDKEN